MTRDGYNLYDYQDLSWSENPVIG